MNKIVLGFIGILIIKGSLLMDIPKSFEKETISKVGVVIVDPTTEKIIESHSVEKETVSKVGVVIVDPTNGSIIESRLFEKNNDF